MIKKTKNVQKGSSLILHPFHLCLLFLIPKVDLVESTLVDLLTFGVDVEGELEESIGLLNHVSTLGQLKEIKVQTLKLEQMIMKRELVEEIKMKMNHNQWQLSCTTLLRILDLHTPNLREWFSTSFKTSTWLKMHIIAYCTTRFQDLDDQLHNVHDLLSNVYNRDNPRNE